MNPIVKRSLELTEGFKSDAQRKAVFARKEKRMSAGDFSNVRAFVSGKKQNPKFTTFIGQPTGLSPGHFNSAKSITPEKALKMVRKIPLHFESGDNKAKIYFDKQGLSVSLFAKDAEGWYKYEDLVMEGGKLNLSNMKQAFSHVEKALNSK